MLAFRMEVSVTAESKVTESTAGHSLSQIVTYAV